MADSPNRNICNSDDAQNIKGDRDVLGEHIKIVKNSDITVAK